MEKTKKIPVRHESKELDRSFVWAKKLGAKAIIVGSVLMATSCDHPAEESEGATFESHSVYTMELGDYSQIITGGDGPYVYPRIINISDESVEAALINEGDEGGGSEEVPRVAEQPPEEVEEPEEEPKTQGLEQLVSRDLPEIAVNRIHNEGIPGKIEAQKAVYTHAENETGVPWQLMAAINYREASLRPELSMLDGSPLTAGTSQDGVKIYNDAEKDAVAAANILKGNAKRYYGVDITDIENLSEEDIANSLLAYNRGAMYLNNPGGPMPVSESPYVYNYMNGDQMRWNRADSYNGSERLNRMYDKGKSDGNLGALVVVTFLAQNT